MRRLAVPGLLIAILLALASPVLADDFYPGDAPPAGPHSGIPSGGSPACDHTRICGDGAVSGGAQNPGQGYNPPGHGDGK